MNSIGSRTKPHVLLVDANTGFRQALSDVLLVYFTSIDVEEACNMSEALSKVECQRPNIVFIDLHLSGGSGLELTRDIKQVYKDIVIVILTIHNQLEYRLEAFRNGADFYISKGDDSCMEDILVRIEEEMTKQIKNTGKKK